MLGGYISDLEKGDVLAPVEYELTALIVSEYAHGQEDECEWYYSPSLNGRQIRPPTLVHADKMRLLETNCAKERRVSGMKSPDARIHYEYDATHHSLAYVGERMVVTGRIDDKYVKRGRQYLSYYMEVHSGDGRLIVSYRDKTLLKYAVEEGPNA